MGENGAGKSTLMKILSGVYPHGTYEGDIVFSGETKQFKRISDSEHAGIAIIGDDIPRRRGRAARPACRRC